MTMRCSCSRCANQFVRSQPVWGKVGASLVSSLGGASLARHPAGAVLGLLFGLAIGHLIDRYVSTRCPLCGALLRLAF